MDQFALLRQKAKEALAENAAVLARLTSISNSPREVERSVMSMTAAELHVKYDNTGYHKASPISQGDKTYLTSENGGKRGIVELIEHLDRSEGGHRAKRQRKQTGPSTIEGISICERNAEFLNQL